MSSVPPYVSDPGSTRPAPKLDAGRLWTGGLATAAVAALVAVVGVLIARGVFDVPVPAWPRSPPSWPPVCCTCCCCPRPARAGSSAGLSGWAP